jgi:hypothetical protein
VTDLLAPLLALPGVEPAVAGARSAIDGLLSHRVLRRGSAEVTAESALRGARRRPSWRAPASSWSGCAGQLMAGTAVVLPARPGRGRARRPAGAGSGPAARRPRASCSSPGGTRPGRRWPGCTSWRPPSWSTTPTRSAGHAAPGIEPDDPLGLGTAPDPLEVAARLDGLARVLTTGTSAPPWWRLRSCTAS